MYSVRLSAVSAPLLASFADVVVYDDTSVHPFTTGKHSGIC